MNTPTQKEIDRSKIYALAINVVFGVVIGVSFTTYVDELVPLVFNFHTILIFIAYSTVIASLVGYNIIIRFRPHRKIFRFVIDVILLYLYFQLMFSPNEDLEFFFVLYPIIFFFYLMWGIVEYFEYRHDDDFKKVPTWKRMINFALSFIFSLLIWIYYSYVYPNNLESPFESPEIIDWLLLFSVFGIVIGFRMFSWIQGMKHGTHD